MLHLETVTDYQDFLALQDSWNTLVEKSSLKSIFVRHEWIRCWWDAYGQDNQLLVLLFKEEGALKAIAPLMISTELFRNQFSVRKVSLIENDETPHSGLIIGISCDINQVLDSLLKYFRTCKESWDILSLRKIHEDSQLLESFPRLATENKETLLVKPSLRSPVLYMNTDWESFYTATSQRFKKKLRYDRNKLKRSGKVDVQLFNTPEQIGEVIEQVFAAGRRSWKEAIGNSIGTTPQNRLFFSKLPHALTQGENGVLLWTLSLDDTIISFEYHIRQGERVYALRGEFDEEYQKSSPGAVLDGEVVQQLFEQGIRAYDMCGDATNQYKLRWTTDVEPYREVTLFNRNIRGTFLAFLEKRIVPVAKRLKRLLKNK
ncbi:MAG: GNAT family N-acetyltransferase [Candidatus Electrothrix sp. AR5]|nr:GNAT family N-acetyltransferase [Candidatus Electrothrix sp. AR5]